LTLASPPFRALSNQQITLDLLLFSGGLPNALPIADFKVGPRRYRATRGRKREPSATEF
jgi:hypothetical protein